MSLRRRPGVPAWVPQPDDHPAYRALWGTFAVLTGLLSAVCAAALADPARVLMLTAVDVLLGTFLGLMWWLVLEPPAASVARGTAALVVGALVAIGLGEVAGYWSLAIVVPLALTSPRLVRALRPGAADLLDEECPSLERLAADRAWLELRPEDAAADPGTVEDLAGLTVRGLCVFWATSARELADRPSAERTVQLVELRAACLEELGQRDPGTVRRWLPGSAAV